MCGIAGIISLQQAIELPMLQKMTDTLVHRGPDGEGHWINNEKNVGFGHRRLSIIDLSSQGKQPMHYLNRYTITFNGEIYNYIEIKNILQQKGYTFHSKTDTEVIMAAYDHWGVSCLSQFDGMFAFALYDNTKREVFIARDRLGEKPFYYNITHNTFTFASEMKALWSIGVHKTPLLQRVYEYLLFSTLENPFNRTQTFYQDIYQLQPAHYAIIKLTHSLQQPEQIQYWDIDIHTEKQISFNEAKEQFTELFISSIKKRLRSDVAVGSSLSGGLDSSAIVCSIKHFFNEEIHSFNTFSAIFPGFSKDESKYIQIVAQHTGFPSYTVTPNPNHFLDYFEKLIYHQEEPYGSASIAAQYEVMQLAKQHQTTVLLDGQGADEILAGYPPLWNTYLKELLKVAPGKFKSELNKFKHNIPEFHYSESLMHAISDLFFYRIKKQVGNFRRRFINPQSEFFLGLHPDLIHEHISVKNPIFSPPDLKAHMKFMLTQRGLNELLRYADRNSMAHSIEVRLPFLNHHLIEFLFSLPDDYIISQGWSKRILRESMDGILPPKIQWRKDKIGYEPPQQDWFTHKDIKEKLNAAITKLKQEHIIQQPVKKLYWKYLMLGEIYE